MNREKREIEFRAWNKEKHCWIENFMSLPLLAGLDLMFQNVSDVEIMQYTGRKDINDKKMYAKDIVRNDRGTGWIEWDNDMSMWRVQSFAWWCELYKFEDTEVLGNVYENKDLL